MKQLLSIFVTMMDKKYTYSVLNQALYHVNEALHSKDEYKKKELFEKVNFLSPFYIAVNGKDVFHFTVRFENGALVIDEPFKQAFSRFIEIDLYELENVVNHPRSMISKLLDKLNILSK